MDIILNRYEHATPLLPSPFLKGLGFGMLTYSLNSSYIAFERFIQFSDYGQRSKRGFLSSARLLHKKYPTIKVLQSSVKLSGINGVSKEMDPKYASCYIHFLCCAGLLKLYFYDYFCSNLTTQVKLKTWLNDYLADYSLDQLAKILVDIGNTHLKRNISAERQSWFAIKAGIYLILRYSLNSIMELKESDWYGFVVEMRNHNKRVQSVGISILHNALWTMGILAEPYSRINHNIGLKKHEIFAKCSDENRILFFKYIRHIEKKKDPDTIRLYINALDYFDDYLEKTKGSDFSIRQLKRSDLINYINNLKSDLNSNGEGYSESWIQTRIYTIRSFLKFVSFYRKEIEEQGIKVFEDNIICDKDFKLKSTVVRKPRGISKEVFQAMLDSLPLVDNVLYKLAFMLMACTGIAVGDLMVLKNDCLIPATDGRYKMRVFRVKVKKYIEISIFKQVPLIIEELLKLNTQQVKLKHPDGSECFFLVNDGGVPKTGIWFRAWLDIHKNIAKTRSTQHDEINEITPHRIRHTFATQLREMDFSIYEIMGLMGHKNINTTRRYTVESDSHKIEMARKIFENEEYYCEAIPYGSMGSSFLESVKGQTFLENFFKFENRFLGGICTIEGHKNCPNAYKCLSCEYLCSTINEIPEILELIQMNICKYDKLKAEYSNSSNPLTKERLLNELLKCRNRILKCKQRYEKLCELRDKKIMDAVSRNSSANEKKLKSTEIQSLFEFY